MTHCEKFVSYVKRKTCFQFFDIWFEYVRQMCKKLKNWICTLSFFVNPVKVKWHSLKQTKSKIRHHFWGPTFHDKELCFLVQKDSFTLKVLKTQFVLGWAMIRNIADWMCNVPYHGSAKDKLHLRTFRVEILVPAKDQSC